MLRTHYKSSWLQHRQGNGASSAGWATNRASRKGDGAGYWDRSGGQGWGREWNRRGEGDEGYGFGKPDFLEVQERILDAAEDLTRFEALVELFCSQEVSLDVVNISTLLHRSGRMRVSLPPHVIAYVTDQLRNNKPFEKTKPQNLKFRLPLS